MGKFFWKDVSKNCSIGPRMSRVRDASPSCPLTGRMKAAGLMYGSQRLPTGQLRFQRGLTRGTPGTISGLIVWVKSALSLLVSEIVGRNGNPLWSRKTPEIVQPPATASTGAHAWVRNL